MNRLSSPVGSHDHGFTLRPLSSTVTGRSLSMQYEAHAMGYELAHDEKAGRVRQLKTELAALEAAA